MTRARAKLLEQQVNLFLAQTDVCIDENFILPKSLHICMIRFEEIMSIARGGEGLHQEEPKVMIIHSCAREEWDAGARGGKIIKTVFPAEDARGGLSGLHPGLSGPPSWVEKLRDGDFQREKAGADYPPPPPRIIRPPDYPA